MDTMITARDLLYPLEWMFRFFIAGMLVKVASPDWAYAFPDLADALISPLSYYLFVIAMAGGLVVQIWVAMKFIASRSQASVPQRL